MRSKAFSIDFVITIFRYFKLPDKSGFSDYSGKYIISRYPSKKKITINGDFFSLTALQTLRSQIKF